MITNLQAIVLAAGKSTRLKNGKTKLCEKICGQELILYPIKMLEQLNLPMTVVVGYQQDLVRTAITNHQCTQLIEFIEQKEPRGTGDAVRCTQSAWNKEHILIMNGDVPFVSTDIITQLYKKHIKSDATISFITAHPHEPIGSSYERILKKGKLIQLFRSKEIHPLRKKACCINGGIYIIKKEFLSQHIDQLMPDHHQETHIYDMIQIAHSQEKRITTHAIPFDSIRGINTYQELWAAEQIKRAELIKFWMDRGVHFAVAQNVHVDHDVIIGSGTFIGCGVHLLSGTIIGSHCTINAFSLLDAAHIGDDVTIDFHSIIRHATIGKQSHVGPFAHIHHESIIGTQTIIGNFVEVKDSIIGNNTKAKHLNYLGNARIGNEVNIGAGTITCNHNGISKEQTIIKDSAYIGSNNSLVAPVTISEHAFTAAGSVITEDVPENSLAIARSRQINKEGYASKLRNKQQDKASFKGARKVAISESAC